MGAIMQTRANMFGDVRAEHDHEILDHSFYEWQDYRAMYESNDRFIVVGRRGTGKSALTYRLSKDSKEKRYSIVIAPNEEQVIGLRPVASLFGTSVSRIRAGVKIAWRYALLLEIGLVLWENYKSKRDVEQRSVLLAHLRGWRASGQCCIERLRIVMRDSLKAIDREEDRIADLANLLQLNRITEDVVSIVSASDRQFTILFDRLDEGYEPDSIGVGLIDGIVYGVDDLRSAFGTNLKSFVFIRDNIFRAIQAEDKDFSRNLESQVLRLHWDPQELFYLVAKRIRNIFSIDKESDVKTWNAITANEIHGREGFKHVLKLTLYRPRDVIALLNAAFYQAQRQSRTTLIEDDFTLSARQISLTRYDDLSKEYESILPGIGMLTRSFAGGAAKMEWQSAASVLGDTMKSDGLSEAVAQHFQILGSPDEAIKTLYGVGFLGFYERQQDSFLFSHDGKRPDRAFGANDVLMIHPCYWLALNLDQEPLRQDKAEEIFDEYEISIHSQSSEQRSHLLGQIISELHTIPLGDDGASHFEDWCKRALEIAFATHLSNIQHKPNGQAVQRRDIVATNQAKEGFWKRVLTDYGTRQVIFEVKNFESIGIDEYRQVHSYLGKEYGRLGFIVCRDPQGSLTKGRELDAFREFYSKNAVIVKLTSHLLVSILSKLRSPEKIDAGSKLLDTTLDTCIRMYANGQSDIGRVTKKRGRK